MNPQPKRKQVKLTKAGWRKLAALVLEIDNWICRACDRERATDAHHVHRRGRLRLDVVGNLVAVCRGCHRLLSDDLLTLEWAEPGYVWPTDSEPRSLKWEAVPEKWRDAGVPLGGDTPETRRVVVRRRCPTCEDVARNGGFGPSHDGSKLCGSGSIASGGTRAHCTCDVCF